MLKMIKNEKNLDKTLYGYTFAFFVIPAKAGMTNGDYKIISIASTCTKVKKYRL